MITINNVKPCEFSEKGKRLTMNVALEELTSRILQSVNKASLLNFPAPFALFLALVLRQLPM